MIRSRLSKLAPALAVAGAFGLAGAPATAADEKSNAANAPSVADLQARAKQIFGTLPAEAVSEKNPVTEEKVKLGRMLYYDERFSLSQTISCNTCHQLDRYGVDNEPTSPGHKGQRGDRNSPTSYNAAFHVAQFWDGRAADVEEQAKGPVLNPVEMAMPSEAYVLRVIESIPGYTPLFQAAFPGEAKPINYDNFAKAVGAFERRLVTKDRFDAFQNGDASALTPAEQKGLATFMEVGCTTCHMGATLGGQMYQKLGLVKPYPTTDKGRAAVTKNAADEHFFKVPSLRNVAMTGPYFHDGKVATLDQAVRIMAEHQLGRTLTDEQAASIVAFLGALTGEIPKAYVARPELPASGPTTPKPQP